MRSVPSGRGRRKGWPRRPLPRTRDEGRCSNSISPTSGAWRWRGARSRRILKGRRRVSARRGMSRRARAGIDGQRSGGMTKTRPAGAADTTPANGAAGTPGPAAPRRSIFDLSRFAPSRVSRPATQDGTRTGGQNGGQNGGQPQQERPKMFGGLGKPLFGYLIFLVVAQYAIPLALSFADSALHLNLGGH